MTELMALLLPDYSGWLLFYIYFVFLLAGVVKGFLGMGMPAVLIITLTLFIPPIEAISLIVLPMLFTNVFQFGRSRARMVTAPSSKTWVWSIKYTEYTYIYNTWYKEYKEYKV